MASQRSKNTGKQLVAQTAAEHPVQEHLHLTGLCQPRVARQSTNSAEQPVTRNIQMAHPPHKAHVTKPIFLTT